MVLLRVGFQDHMPAPHEAADVVLVDIAKNNAITAVEQSRAWNPQQGTMFYWNPKAADTQLIFNDRDLKTNRVFAVLYDIQKRKRLHEYRYSDTPFGNSGVAQRGGYFLGLNYGRMARLRPVTGYPGAFDWNPNTPAPDNDGIFLTEIESGKKKLLVTFKQLADLIAPKRPDIAGKRLLHQPYALESRRQPHLLLRARRLREEGGKRGRALHDSSGRLPPNDAPARRRTPGVGVGRADDWRS